jgi:hypothetical protein
MISSFGLCLVSTRAELRKFEQPAKTDRTLSFLTLWDWAEKVLSTSLKLLFKFYQLPCFSLIYIMFLYVCARVGKELKKRHATYNWHFYLLKSFPSINSCLWFAWKQKGRIGGKLDTDLTLIPLIFSGWPRDPTPWLDQLLGRIL